MCLNASCFCQALLGSNFLTLRRLHWQNAVSSFIFTFQRVKSIVVNKLAVTLGSCVEGGEASPWSTQISPQYGRWRCEEAQTGKVWNQHITSAPVNLLKTLVYHTRSMTPENQSINQSINQSVNLSTVRLRQPQWSCDHSVVVFYWPVWTIFTAVYFLWQLKSFVIFYRWATLRQRRR